MNGCVDYVGKPVWKVHYKHGLLEDKFVHASSEKEAVDVGLSLHRKEREEVDLWPASMVVAWVKKVED